MFQFNRLAQFQSNAKAALASNSVSEQKVVASDSTAAHENTVSAINSDAVSNHTIPQRKAELELKGENPNLFQLFYVTLFN